MSFKKIEFEGEEFTTCVCDICKDKACPIEGTELHDDEFEAEQTALEEGWRDHDYSHVCRNCINDLIEEKLKEK